MSPATPFFRNIAAFRLLLCILFRICSGCCLRFSIETAPVTGIMITAIIGSFFFFSSIVILFLISAVRISALRIIYILIVSLSFLSFSSYIYSYLLFSGITAAYCPFCEPSRSGLFILLYSVSGFLPSLCLHEIVYQLFVM